MPGLGVLFALLLISSIPAIAVFLWFRFARYPFSTARFSVFLLAGAASLFPALLLQNMLAGVLPMTGRWGFAAEIFIRIAFTEELSRLLVLLLLFLASRRVTPPGAHSQAGAAGLIAGFGFAILESATYGAANPINALLRAVTAAPLHGACGFRVGAAIEIFPQSPVLGTFRFLNAVIIHGVYNSMLMIPGFLPPLGAILIALSSLAAAVVAIRNDMRQENP